MSEAPEPRRTIAIGDVHGCARALAALLDAIGPNGDDLIVPLGDYVDRGPDSRGVLEILIRLADACQLRPILGNHDEMLLLALDDPNWHRRWLAAGGWAVLDSYGGGVDRIPDAHRDFLRACLDFHETPTHAFTHACYAPALPFARQSEPDLRWRSLRDGLPGPHASGKAVILGHSSQKDGVILDAGHLIGIDTFCYGGGWLTALEVETGRYWQASANGTLRDTPPEVRQIISKTNSPRTTKDRAS